jgi:hypothetical protein
MTENPFESEPRTIRELLDVMDLCEESETRWALEKLVQRREEAIPEILRDIEKVRDIPEGVPVILGDRWFLEILLLAQFRESRAVPILIEQFSKDSDHIETLFREFTTEDLARVLASVSVDDPEPLKKLIENPEVCEWVRAETLTAFGILASEGVLPKTVLKTYLAELFNGKLERSTSMAWNEWVSLIGGFQFHDLLSEANLAFENGWVEKEFMHPSELIADFQKPLGVPLRDDVTIRRGFIRDVFKEIEKWEWAYPQADPIFDEDGDPIFPGDTSPFGLREKPGRNQPCPCGSGKKYKKCCGR